MNDVSIKVLDVLFDLCEGEGYRILEAEEITSRVSFHDFLPDELTEILEVLVADGMIELKYADNREYCVAMRTKGRALIKQSRERLSKLVAEAPEIQSFKEELREAETDRQERIALKEKKEQLEKQSEDLLRKAQESFDSADSSEEKKQKKAALQTAKEENKKQQMLITELENRIALAETRERMRMSRSLMNAVPDAEKAQESEKKERPADPKKVFLFALLGSALGAVIVNLIFMILIFKRVC